MKHKLCTICNNNITIDFINLSDEDSCNLRLCNNCFHIQSNNDKCNYKKLNTENVLFNLIINKIESKIFKNPIKILNLNDINTKILDDIYYKYNNIKTVSLSNLFNPSFFSKHECHKNDLTDWNFNILKNTFDTFDIIILNSTLSFNKNINDILEKCEKLSHKNTILFSTSYDISNIHSHVFFFNLNNNIKNIFNTNSMNRLCNKHNFLLKLKHEIVKDEIDKDEKDKHEIVKNEIFTDETHETYYTKIIIYEFSLKSKLNSSSEVITEDLYKEILCNLYDENIYKSISDNFIKNYNLFNDMIHKYYSQNYNIVILDKSYKNLNSINVITNLNEIKLQNLYDKYLFIIFDLENFEKIYLDLKLQIQLNYKLNLSKCLILDINLLIVHPIYN